MGSVVGIDPGLTGAMVLLNAEGQIVAFSDMPVFTIDGKNRVNVHGVGTLLSQYNADGARAVIEQVGAMPGQGVSSMFNFGFAAGAVHGAVGAIGMPLQTVTPQKWKKYFGLSKDKDAARQLATRKWPDGPFSRKKDAGRAEAALIALYALETEIIRKGSAQ